MHKRWRMKIFGLENATKRDAKSLLEEMKKMEDEKEDLEIHLKQLELNVMRASRKKDDSALDGAKKEVEKTKEDLKMLRRKKEEFLGTLCELGTSDFPELLFQVGSL